MAIAPETVDISYIIMQQAPESAPREGSEVAPLRLAEDFLGARWLEELLAVFVFSGPSYFQYL